MIGAVVLFSYLESYAEVANPTYRVGGAVAGFFVVFVTLVTAYSRLVAKPASKLMTEASRAITKPKGFREYRLPESGYSIYYPEKWELVEKPHFPSVSFDGENGSNIIIGTAKANKGLISDFLENNASQYFGSKKKSFEELYKDYKVLEGRTIALHGVQCPMLIGEMTVGHHTVRHMQIAYLDVKGEKLHVITCSAHSHLFEKVRPLFEKIVSTFQII